MKRTFGKSLILFVLVVVFSVAMLVGCTTLSVDSVASTDTGEITYNDESSVSITTENTVLSGEKGSRLELAFEVKMKNNVAHEKKWGAVDLILWSSNPDIWEFGNFSNGKRYEYEAGSPFADINHYTTNLSYHEDADGGHDTGFIRFTMAAQPDGAVLATTNVKFKIALKLKQDIDTAENLKVDFKLNERQYNSISSYIYTGDQQTNEEFNAFPTGDKDKDLNVSAAHATVAITKLDSNAKLGNLWIEDQTLAEAEQRKDFIVNTEDKATRPFHYEITNAANGKIKLFADPANPGATIQVQIGTLDSNDQLIQGTLGTIYAQTAGPIKGGEGIVLNLSSGKQRIYITVSSADKTETLDYTIDFQQTYVGLDDFKISTNNKVEGVTKNGLSADTPFNADAEAYTVYAPVGASNSATIIEFTPAFAEGYGIHDIYIIEDENNNTAERRNKVTYAYNLPNASSLVGGEQFELTFKFTGATGNVKSVVVTIITVSVDTTLSSLQLANTTIVNPQLTNGQYTSQLKKNNNYNTSIIFDVNNAQAKAELKDKDNTFLCDNTGTANIGVIGDQINQNFYQEEFNYNIIVTAEAGNVTTYPLVLTKEIVAGKIVSLEYSTKQLDDGSGFDWTEGNVKTIASFDANSTEPEQSLDLKLDDFDISRIGFRIMITDGAEIRTVGVTNRFEVNKATNSKDVFACYTFALQQIRQGVTEVDFTVSSATSTENNGTGYKYKINVIRTENDYSITNITMKYTDKEGVEHNLIENFSTLVADIDVLTGAENTNKFEVPFAAETLKIDVYTKGYSTVVTIGGYQASRTKNTDASIEADTIHTFTLSLDPGRQTITNIVSKGTDGIVENSATDRNFTVYIDRLAAKSINYLNDLKAYLKNADDEYINSDGQVVADRNDAQIIMDFKQTTTYYYCSVGENVAYAYVEIDAILPDNSGATLDGNGKRYVGAPAGATRELTVTVTPENSKYGLGRTTYSITITANVPQPSNKTAITNINMITNNGVNLLHSLTNGLPEDLTTKTNPYKLQVSYSSNAFSIIIGTEDITTKVYIVKVVDKDAAIDWLKPNFDYTNEGWIPLEVGANLFAITSFAQDGTQGKEYFFEITRNAANSNVGLKNISALTPFRVEMLTNFNTNITDYSIYIPSASGCDSLDFTVEANNGLDATIRMYESGKIIAEKKGSVLNLNTKNLFTINQGDSKVFVIEVSADGISKQYTVSVKRQYDIGYIDSISSKVEDSGRVIRDIVTESKEEKYSIITNENLVDAIIDGKIRDFFVYVPYESASVSLTLTAPKGMRLSSANNQLFDIADIFGEETGTWTHSFSVTNGDVITSYTFNIVREQPRTASTLEEIEKFTIAEIPDFVFDINKANYKYIVEYSVATFTETILFKEARFAPSYTLLVNGVEIKDEQVANLACGLNNVEVIFTASDKSTSRTITFAIERKHAAVGGITITDKTTNNTIDAGISIVDGINSYAFAVNNGVHALDLNLQLADGYTMGEVVGNSNFKVGETNKVTVEIKDASGAVVRVLQFNVYRMKADPTEPSYTMWYIIAGVLGGLALILLILTIVGFTTGSGKKRKGNINDIGIGDFNLD